LHAATVMAHDGAGCNLVHMAVRHRLLEDPPSVRFVKKAIVVFVALHVPLALWSGYRAIIQVQRLELVPAARQLSDGSTVRVDVVSSGRTTVDVRLEMIQAERAEMLGVRRVPSNGNAAYDPRFQHASMTVVVTPEILGRFEPGLARLRATARGRPQWLREPPPEVRELPVELLDPPRR
jgi:hypothetical protein